MLSTLSDRVLSLVVAVLLRSRADSPAIPAVSVLKLTLCPEHSVPFSVPCGFS